MLKENKQKEKSKKETYNIEGRRGARVGRGTMAPLLLLLVVLRLRLQLELEEDEEEEGE